MQSQYWGQSLVFKLVFSVIVVSSLVSSVSAGVVNIDSYEVKDLISNGVVLVDVREEQEWKDTGVIPKSHLITFFDSYGGYDTHKWMNKLREIAVSDDPVIIICRSGRRSRIVGQYLAESQGYRSVFNALSGINGWKRDKLNLEDYKLRSLP